MKTLSLVWLAVLMMSGSAHAEEGYVLHGLFCNTEGQIDETLDHMRSDLSPQAAVALTNEKEVVCVYADRIKYMVIHPIILGETNSRPSLAKYRATLVGVLVGGKSRPIEPSVQIFFVTPERLTGATASGKT